MNNSGLFTIGAVVLLAASLVYQLGPLRRTKIWYLSLQQIMLLVVIPGLIFPMLFSYLQSMLRLPRHTAAILPDGFLVSIVLLSTLFAYGGIAIHAVTKMMSEYLVNTKTEAEQINKFFHTKFSHNLAFTGIVTASLGLTLLELNHIPPADSISIFWGVMRGLMLGGSFAFATYNYTRYTGGDFVRWNDLKVLFASIWVGLVVLLYGIQKVDSRLTSYQLLLPILLSFSVMAILSLVLVVRRLKRGGWRVRVGKRRLREYLALEERA